MAHATTPVTTTQLPAVGLCPVTLPADGPSIRILDMPSLGGYLIAYDKHTWTHQQIDHYIRMYLGDYELIQAPEGGA